MSMSAAWQQARSGPRRQSKSGNEVGRTQMATVSLACESQGAVFWHACLSSLQELDHIGD